LREGKRFFSEEKKQKTFFMLGLGRDFDDAHAGEQTKPIDYCISFFKFIPAYSVF